MTHRLVGLAIVVFWVVATSWLVWHDIVPAWTAQEPPRMVAADWVQQFGRQVQYGILNHDGRRVGGIWTRYTSGSSTDREDEIYVRDVPLLGSAYLLIRSSYDAAGLLDEVDINVLGHWDPIRIHGERFPKEFAFRLEAGAVKQAFKIDLALAGTFSDVFRPFDVMPQLEVGQSWRMQVFNPVATVTGVGDRFIPMLVKVVGRDVLHVDGQPRDCMIVEAGQAQAWVERRSGLALKQKINLPILGGYTVLMEGYDDAARLEAKRRFDRAVLDW
ncbi:MAG: hypothetical protein HOP29_04835 [Phycisphaerales bacterium]|nr:hypothetical protein [Phycisphaerales bacterium]